MFKGLNLYATGSDSNGKPILKGNIPTGKKVISASTTKTSGYVVKSGINPYFNSGSVGMTAVSKNSMVNFLDGFIVEDVKLKRQLFKNIYDQDPIAGGAIDIFSELPFSSFDLTGIEDEDVLEVYQKSCDNIRPKELIPGVSKDFLTYGVFIGTSLFDKNEKVFTNIMPLKANDCEVTEIPIYGLDPLINLQIPNEIKKVLKDKDPRMQKLLEDLPKEIRQEFNKPKIELSPDTTIYMPRRTLTEDILGTSYLERMLPLHLLEKTLFRGTLDQANRRQRAILHIIAGDEEWIPPQEDLNSIRDLFQEADSDPTGAIIVTRGSISPNEVRAATDFWRYDEMDGYFSVAKYRALKISEALITVSTLDATLSVLVDNFRAYREMITSALFYNKLFPAIAVANDFKSEDYIVKGSRRSGRSGSDYKHRVTINGTNSRFIIKSKIYDTKNLAIPQIEWHKHLKPEGDTAYIELLASLGDRGVPVTLGMYAAAAGINIDSVVKSMDPDIKLRKEVAKYLKQVGKINADIQPPMGDDDQQQQMQAAEIVAGMISKGTASRRVGILNREFDEREQMHERKKNGKIRVTSRRRRKELQERAYKVISEALANQAKRENKRIRKGRERDAKILVSPIYGILSNKKDARKVEK